MKEKKIYSGSQPRVGKHCMSWLLCGLQLGGFLQQAHITTISHRRSPGGKGGEGREEGSGRAGGFECVSLPILFTGDECPFTPRVARLQRCLAQHCDAIVGSTLLQVKILEAPTASRLQKTKDKVKWEPESD